MRTIEMGPWDPVWEAGEHGPHARVRAYAAGKLAVFRGDRPTGITVPVLAYAVRAGDLTIAVDGGLGARWRQAEGAEVPDAAPAADLRYHPVLEGPTFAEQLAG